MSYDYPTLSDSGGTPNSVRLQADRSLDIELYQRGADCTITCEHGVANQGVRCLIENPTIFLLPISTLCASSCFLQER